MTRLFLLLQPFIRAALRRPGSVMLLAIIMTAVGIFFAKDLKVDTDIANLLPPEYNSVRALNSLKSVVGGESSLAIGISSPSFDANKLYAETLIPLMLDSRHGTGADPIFSRVDYRRDTEFLENNALYFGTLDELRTVENYLRDQIEEARLKANPFYFDLEEDEESDSDSTETALNDAYERIVGTEYPISDDSTTMALHFYLTASNTNIGSLGRVYALVEKLVADLGTDQFHAEMQVVVAGRPYRRLSEVTAITADIARSFGIGVFSVLLLVIIYFGYKLYAAQPTDQRSYRLWFRILLRAPLLGLLIAIPLVMSLTWTFALAAVVLESLNLMTSTLGLVLFGLGIDFGIHFYARYMEYRSEGVSALDSAEQTFLSTGQAVTIGGITTAAGLFVLVAADFRGFSEFGFMAGSGIVFALFAMLVVLPALIMLFERAHLLHFSSDQAAEKKSTRQSITFRYYKTILVVSAILMTFAVINFGSVGFEYEFGKLEPTFETYNKRQDVIGRVVGSQEGRRNPAYFLLEEGDSATPVVDKLIELKERDMDTPTIGIIESLDERFPLDSERQEQKLAKIAVIRELLKDTFLEEGWTDDLERLRNASSTTKTISLEDIPDKLRKRFSTKDGQFGRFVIVYPSVGLSDARNSIAFREDVGRIETSNGKIYFAASSSIIAADMLSLMMKESPWIVSATLMMVLLLMLLHFKSVRWGLVAMSPLIVGILWMFVLMVLFDIKLNFYNLIVLPAVLGIGNDDGVHLTHRYLEEGKGSIGRVLRSTGEHVTMTTLTTMVGFSGLLFSFHPGLRSIGELAVVGIGATLLASLLFLPALLILLEKIEDRSAQF